MRDSANFIHSYIHLTRGRRQCRWALSPCRRERQKPGTNPSVESAKIEGLGMSRAPAQNCAPDSMHFFKEVDDMSKRPIGSQKGLRFWPPSPGIPGNPWALHLAIKGSPPYAAQPLTNGTGQPVLPANRGYQQMANKIRTTPKTRKP